MKITKTAPENWDFFNEHGASLGAYKLIGFIGQLLSGISLAYAAYALILAQVLKSGLSAGTAPVWGLALLLAVFIELANRILARRAIKPIVKNGLFKEDPDLHKRHKVLNRSYMIGLCGIALTSYFLSGVGSFYYAEDSSDGPAQIDTDSIKQHYDQQQAQIDQAFIRDTQLITAPYIARIKAAENRFQSDSLALRKERERYRACAAAGNQWCKTKLTDHLAQIDRARAQMNDSLGVISSQKATALLATLNDRNTRADKLTEEKKSEVFLATQTNTDAIDKDAKNTGFKGIVFIIITFIGQTVFYLMVYLILQVEAGSEITYQVEPNELWNLPSVVAEFWTTLAWKTERGARHVIALLFGEPRESVNTKIPYRSLQDVEEGTTKKTPPGPAKSGDPLKRHEKAAKKTAGKGYNMHNLRRELRKYKKRHARFVQQKLDAERKGEVVSQRTLDAIENNAGWVAHYEQLIIEKELELKS